MQNCCICSGKLQDLQLLPEWKCLIPQERHTPTIFLKRGKNFCRSVSLMINVPSNFLKSMVTVQIRYLLCNILPGLICICDDVNEICVKPFLKGNFLCAPSFLVCARLTTRAQLKGNIAGDEFPIATILFA